ncbi:translation initiation factor IF-2-like [Schistocerca americana]|uniref:translation initiation factor IF-2-like n=1 Tax=Schistocerca americana TaxID=7009 RepID=UPI001F4FD4DE|nr:translation initiation factor IF-2-like [Schistocerca americana]
MTVLPITYAKALTASADDRKNTAPVEDQDGTLRSLVADVGMTEDAAPSSIQSTATTSDVSELPPSTPTVHEAVPATTDAVPSGTHSVTTTSVSTELPPRPEDAALPGGPEAGRVPEGRASRGVAAAPGPAAPRRAATPLQPAAHRRRREARRRRPAHRHRPPRPPPRSPVGRADRPRIYLLLLLSVLWPVGNRRVVPGGIIFAAGGRRRRAERVPAGLCGGGYRCRWRGPAGGPHKARGRPRRRTASHYRSDLARRSLAGARQPSATDPSPRLAREKAETGAGCWVNSHWATPPAAPAACSLGVPLADGSPLTADVGSRAHVTNGPQIDNKAPRITPATLPANGRVGF